MIKSPIRTFKQLAYPLMRDPQGNPKCYELTEAERIASVELADELLLARELDNAEQYWGA